MIWTPFIIVHCVKGLCFLSPYRCVCVCVCLCVCVTAVAPISLTREDSFHPPPPALPVPISIWETGVLCSAGWMFDNMPVSALRIILITVFPIVHVKRITIPFDDAQCWKPVFKGISKGVLIYIFIYVPGVIISHCEITLSLFLTKDFDWIYFNCCQIVTVKKNLSLQLWQNDIQVQRCMNDGSFVNLFL